MYHKQPNSVSHLDPTSRRVRRLFVASCALIVNLSWRKLAETNSLLVTTLIVTLWVSTGCTQGRYPPGYPSAYPTGAGAVGATGAGPGFQPNGVTIQAPTTGPNSVFAQQVTNPQLVELQRRVQQLDDNNRELTSQLAQAQQQGQAFRERSELLARQLDDLTTQNKQLVASTRQYAAQAQGLQNSLGNMQNEYQSAMTRRGGARLTANNSLRASTIPSQIAGIQTLTDGNRIRMLIPADQLFAPGTANPNPAGSMILDQVAAALLRQYPRQQVSIEGHTDDAQAYGAYGTPYQLAGAQAQVVMDHLVRRNGVPMQQLSTVAHGPNRPLVTNTSPMARSQNRRIEIVVNPDSF